MSAQPADKNTAPLPEPSLERGLGPWQATALNIANMVHADLVVARRQLSDDKVSLANQLEQLREPMVRRIFTKLHVADRAQAIVGVRKAGLGRRRSAAP